LGSAIESTSEKQKIEKIRVYPGADADFTLYDDDGKTYAYEKGESRITRLHWDDVAKKLTHEGSPAWSGPDSDIIEIVH
jgi:alpha-D-xyloside xylohydrolase